MLIHGNLLVAVIQEVVVPIECIQKDFLNFVDK